MPSLYLDCSGEFSARQRESPALPGKIGISEDADGLTSAVSALCMFQGEGGSQSRLPVAVPGWGAAPWVCQPARAEERQLRRAPEDARYGAELRPVGTAATGGVRL